jgi:hypothetical protein
MIASIITKTMDLVVLSAKEREQVAAYREQVYDEVALNLALVHVFLGKAKRVRLTVEDADALKALLASLKDSSFQRVSSGELSLKRVLPDKLKRPAQPEKSDGKGTRQYLLWIQEDKTAGELLRRYYRKIEFLKRMHTTDTGVDVRYLGFMLWVVSNSIKK